ncbi:hypothetical protein GW17_00023374, partial [Ensete ventricosum]
SLHRSIAHHIPADTRASEGCRRSRKGVSSTRRRGGGETVVAGGTGGKSLDAQERLVEGRRRGGQTRREQMGTEGYHEMGRKGGLSTMEESGGERAQREGIEIDESKFTKHNG